MRILFLTQYFPPETGAPQNRLHSLAINLAGHNNEVTVLTAMPNYPKMQIFEGYRRKFYIHEKEGSLTLHRSWIFVGKNKGALSRLLTYFSFVFSSTLIGLTKIGRQDLIICESPPLFLGITALILRKAKKAKLVFNVSDLWPASVEELGIITNNFLIKSAYKLEGIIYRKSLLVTGQTNGIINNIKNRHTNVKTYWLPNGIDFDQFDVNADGDIFRHAKGIEATDFILVYAGVFGHAQSLETILDTAEMIKSFKDIHFFLIGDGPERDMLLKVADRKKLDNLTFIPNMPRETIPGMIAACDAYLVPLKKNDLFLGAIPSKLFEPLAMGKPILLGVDGEARKLFIDEGRCGLYSEPEKASDLLKNIMILYSNRVLANELGENGSKYVRGKFDRRIIAENFHRELIRLCDGRK